MQPLKSWLAPNFGVTLCLPFLGLSTPFIGYVTHRKYALMSLEVWLILAGMVLVSFGIASVRLSNKLAYAVIVAAILTFTADYSFEWIALSNRFVVLSVFVAMVALIWRIEETFVLVVSAFLCVFVTTTLVRAAFNQEIDVHTLTERSAVSAASGPRLFHLVLDEHIGIEGIPTDTVYARQLKRKVKDFYQYYGFELYGGAYSRHFLTINSIPSLVNFSLESLDRAFVLGKESPHQLRENRYFKYLNEQGYQINVVGSDYIDFCSGHEALLRSCVNYSWWTLQNLSTLEVSLSTKTSTLLAMFLAKYDRYQKFLSVYENSVHPLLLSYGLSVPVLNRESLWTNRRFEAAPLNAMPAIDALSKGMLQLPRGNMLFAHLMLPHSPYVFREDCSPRPIPQSLDNHVDMSDDSRTREGRSLRYDQYLRQIECLYLKLDDLFRRMQAAGIFDDSILILHGDHGARLGLHSPRVREQADLTMTDYVDALSTLFATRIPGKPSRYDPSLHAIDHLLVDTLSAALGRPPVHSLSKQNPFVYLGAGNRKEQVRVELPWMPPASPCQAAKEAM